MPRLMRLPALLLGVLATIAAGTAAVAHEDHGGFSEPSPVSSSANMKLLATSPKGFATNTTYRNSDLAFWGRTAISGNYAGFRTIDISDPEKPVVLSDFDCPGAQHDVTVWKGLLFTSIDSPITGPECGAPRSPAGVPGFEGIRIFDISNPSQPAYVGAVPTDCGSHTHTLVPDPDDASHVYLYVASYSSSVIPEHPVYGNACLRFDEAGERAQSKISVIEVPLADPAAASVVSEPRLPLNDYAGTPGFTGCHDISVFLEVRRAAAACMSEGQIWDLSDLENPRTIGRIHNPNVEFWHSAAFTWDATTVLFGDEAGGGTQPRCRTTDPDTLGAIWIYDVAAQDTMDASTVEPALSHFKIPRVQGDVARCTMHNFNVIPVQGRYVAVSAAYSGGTTVFDFTDRSNPVEVGHHDPHGANTWSSYWYNGFVYTNDTGRGFEVMLLADAARAGAQKLPYLNPQTQERVLR